MSTHIENGRIVQGRVLLGGSAVDTVAGLAAVVLAILGLVGVVPVVMASLAVLVLGAGFFSQGLSTQARYRAIVSETPETHMGPAGFGSGVAAETIGGFAALALGVIALIRLDPSVLVPVATIGFGGIMILGSTMLYRLNEYLISHSEPSKDEKAVSDEAARGTSDIHLFVGIGAIVLGILSLMNPASLSLVFVALIGVGAANAISGGEIVKRSTVALEHV